VGDRDLDDAEQRGLEVLAARVVGVDDRLEVTARRATLVLLEEGLAEIEACRLLLARSNSIRVAVS
jgi:hypothetical protein